MSQKEYRPGITAPTLVTESIGASTHSLTLETKAIDKLQVLIDMVDHQITDYLNNAVIRRMDKTTQAFPLVHMLFNRFIRVRAQSRITG